MAVTLVNNKQQYIDAATYRIDHELIDTAMFCLVITNMGMLLKDYGFRAGSVGYCKSAYSIADRLEASVRKDLYKAHTIREKKTLWHDGQLLTFRLRDLVEEYENHLVANYDYVDTESGSEKGGEV